MMITGKELISRVAESGCCVQVIIGTEVRYTYTLTADECNEYISGDGLNEFINNKGDSLIIKDDDEFNVTNENEYSLGSDKIGIKVILNREEWC